MERSYGSFERAVPLPVEVDEAKAKAEFKNGVLRLSLPKHSGAQARRKKIPVK
jgi:HSP20 family protein